MTSKSKSYVNQKRNHAWKTHNCAELCRIWLKFRTLAGQFFLQNSRFLSWVGVDRQLTSSCKDQSQRIKCLHLNIFFFIHLESFRIIYLWTFSNFKFCHLIAAMARMMSLFSNSHYKFPGFFFLFLQLSFFNFMIPWW